MFTYALPAHDTKQNVSKAERGKLALLYAKTVWMAKRMGGCERVNAGEE